MKEIVKKIIVNYIFLIFLFSLPVQLFSQNKEIENEILVYILPDSLEMQNGRAVENNINDLRIKSHSLQKLLQKIELNSIEKAFPDFREEDTVKTTRDGKKIKLPDMSRIFSIKLNSKEKVKETVNLLSKERSVLFAEQNGEGEPLVIPNDTYFSYQWYLNNTGQSGGTVDADIDAPEAWDIYKGSSNNIIAIIDGGIDKNHPDLSGKVTGDNGYGWNGHGIHVAGIAAAKTNNNTGIAGIDWYAKLHSERVDGTDDVGKYNALVDAVNYSPQVYVLNNSWRLVNPIGRYSTTVRLAFTYAYKMNRVAIVAMGNDGNSTTQYPAGFGQGIIAVGATENTDNRISFSSFGNHIDVTAPGVNIYSTYLNNGYDNLSGTSMAAPIVSGIASLLKGYKPDLDNDDIENIIKISAEDVNFSTNPSWDQYYGTGRVNAHKALDHLRSPYLLMHRTATGGTIYSFSPNKELFTIMGASGLTDGDYWLERYNVRKTVPIVPNLIETKVWGRGVHTNGWSDDPKFAMPWCGVVPGSIQGNNVTLETYCYKMYNLITDGTVTGITWDFVGWYPCPPSQVEFAYTIHGREVPPLSVTISGPDFLFGEIQPIRTSTGTRLPPPSAIGTWVANPQGGVGNYSYQWYWHTGLEWAEFASGNQQSLTDQIFGDRNFKCLVTSGTDTASATIHVDFDYLGNHPIANSKTPEETKLVSNYPNPFNPATEISYQLKEEGEVKITVYDMLGRKVVDLVNTKKPAGFYKVSFNAENLPSGVYIYRMQVGNFVSTKKMILAK